MLTTRIPLVLLTLALVTLAEIEAAQTQTQTSKNGLTRMCAAAKQFLATYQSSCDPNKTATQGKKVESTLHTLCAVALCTTNQTCPPAVAKTKRFYDADDITESDQMLRIDSRRGLNRMDEKDLCSERTEHIEAVLSHIHRVLNYFNTLSTVQLSSTLFATRTIQAQIAKTLENAKFTPDHSGLLNKLKFLQEYSQTIAKQLENTNSENWNWIDRMMSSTFFWKMPKCQNAWKPWETLGSKEAYPVSEFRNLSEYHTQHEANNECYLQMVKDCGLTQECADLLMDKSPILTTLGHNVRFFQVAITMDCVKEVDFVNKFRGSDWETVLEGQCSKMWNEANIIANADFPTGYKGLFLVHATSCAFVGYPNFLRADWMKRIMSWIRLSPNGCIPPDTKSGDGDASSEYDARADNGEWCSHWETSLAAQVLITHLRYFFETCSPAGNGIQV